MRADARENRSLIVAAGQRLIAAHGADVSLSAVAEEAGVGIATLYRNFRTREDLISAVLFDLQERMLRIVDEYAPLLESDPEEAWTNFARALAGLRPGALVAAFATTFVNGEQVSEGIAAERVRALAASEQFLDAAKTAGVVRADVTVQQFHVGIATITRPLPDVAAPDLTQGDEWLIDVYLRGLRP